MDERIIDFHPLDALAFFPTGVNGLTATSIRRVKPRDVMQVVFLDALICSPTGDWISAKEVTTDWLWQYFVAAKVQTELGLGHGEILFVPLVQIGLSTVSAQEREAVLGIFTAQQLALERLKAVANKQGLPEILIIPDYELCARYSLNSVGEFRSANYLGKKCLLASKLSAAYAPLSLLFLEQTDADNLHEHLYHTGEPCGMAPGHCCPMAVDFARSQQGALASYFFLQPRSYQEAGRRVWAGLAKEDEVSDGQQSDILGCRIPIWSSESLSRLWPDVDAKKITPQQVKHLLHGAWSSLEICLLAEEILGAPLDISSPQQAWEMSLKVTNGSDPLRLPFDRQVAVYSIWRAYCYPYSLWLQSALGIERREARQRAAALTRSEIL